MKYRCTFAYTMRGEATFEASSAEEARQRTEDLPLMTINDLCREVSMDVATVRLDLSPENALRALQVALANYRDGVSPMLVIDGHAIETIEELKYLVVDPALGDARDNLWLDAVEWVDVNIIGAWHGPNTPIVMQGVPE